MIVSQERATREDREFWDAALQVCQLLVPELGLPMPSFALVSDPCTTKARAGGRAGEEAGEEEPLFVRYNQVLKHSRSILERLVCEPVQNVPGFRELLYFFSASPEWMIPFEGYACYPREGDGPIHPPGAMAAWEQITGLYRPVGLDQMSLLLVLCEMVRRSGSVHGAYAFALCRQAYPEFRQLDAGEPWDMDQVEGFRAEQLPVAAMTGAMGVLFPLWLRYLRRHYDRRLWGRDNMSAAKAVADCLEGSRYTRGTVTDRTVWQQLSLLPMIDDTLCLPRGEHGMRPIRTLANAMGLPGSERELTKLLRLYQQAAAAEARKRRPKDGSGAPRCREILLMQSALRYIVSYQREEKRFSCTANGEDTGGWRSPVQISSPQQLEPPVEYLYRLTGGDEAVLRELARAAALCAARGKRDPKAIVADDGAAVLLMWITGALEEDPVPLSTLCKAGAADELIARKWGRQSVVLACHDGKRMPAEEWKRLGKLISGATVAYSDPVLGRKKHRNEAQWLILGDELTAQELTKHGIRSITLKCGKAPEIFEGTRASDWVKIFLPLWGLMQLSRRGGVSSAKRQAPRTLEQFWADCCDLDGESGFIPARTVYDAYRAYCGEQGDPAVLLLKDFNREFEQRSGLARVRRHRTGSNPTGYVGLRLIKNAPPQKDEEEQARQAFRDLVGRIEGEVRSAFPDIPFFQRP